MVLSDTFFFASSAIIFHNLQKTLSHCAVCLEPLCCDLDICSRKSFFSHTRQDWMKLQKHRICDPTHTLKLTTTTKTLPGQPPVLRAFPISTPSTAYGYTLRLIQQPSRPTHIHTLCRWLSVILSVTGLDVRPWVGLMTPSPELVKWELNTSALL